MPTRIEEDVAEVAARIARAPGGYRTRTGRRPGMIRLAGGKLKGWIEVPLAEALRVVGLDPTPRPSKAA